ncbi:MAG: PQQ-binding-like beta-propeller repeat protein [Candidatus Hydrogenedens sp.]|nr:PQQ-binding-like beta-propeller repeat protein [Candidatus Hydrogenedens sp.]
MKSVRLCPVLLCAFTFVLLAENLQASEPQELWSFNTGAKIYAPPLVTDLDGDGYPEIIVPASRSQRLLCLNGVGEVKWEFALDDENADGFHAAVSAVDYDGDGEKEIFFLTRGGTAGCLDAEGLLIWRVYLDDEMDYTGPVLADINGDGRVELLFGSESGTLYCLSDTGEILWRHQRRGGIRGIPAVTALQPDGALRLVAVWSGGEEACYDGDGNVLWEFDEPLPAGERRSGVAIGDLEGQGTMTVITATEDYQMIARSAETGEECWRFKGKGRIDQTCSFALVDFDGSGQLDVVGGDSSGCVYRIRNGEALWATETGGGIVQGPAVGDLDGDGIQKVLVCSRSSRLLCLHGESGEILWDFETPAAPLTTPVVADVTGDGRLEILFTSKDNYLYCLRVKGSGKGGTCPWPMIQKDAQLSGNARGDALFTPSPATDRPDNFPAPISAPEEVELHSGENVIAFEFTNDSYRSRHLEVRVDIVSPEGETSTRLYSAFLPPYAQEQRRLRFDALQSGRYGIKWGLSDLGTGERLVTMARLFSFSALQEEELRLQSLQEEGERRLSGLQDRALQERAQAAFSNALAEAREACSMARDGDRVIPEKLPKAHSSLDALEQAVAPLRVVPPGTENLVFGVASTSSLIKVFPDAAFPPLSEEGEVPAEMSICLAKNEYESAQLVVVPLWSDVHELTIEADRLVHSDGAGSIDASQITLYQIGYVEIGLPEYSFAVERVGLYPDLLQPFEPMSIPASQHAQPFQLTVKTLPDTAPGLYEGKITVRAQGAAAVEMALKVWVWDFALPERNSLITSFWMNENYIRQFYKYEERLPEEIRRAYYDLHLKYRVGPIKTLPLEGGELLDDMEYVLDRGQDAFFVSLPVLKTEEQRAEFQEKLLRTRDLVQEKGWEDKALFYTYDEVAVMARHLIPEVVSVNEWARNLVPQWPLLQTSAPEQSLTGAVDIWCPTIDTFNPAYLKQRMDAGDRLWMYTVWERPGIMIEFPNTDYRIMFWQCWKYGAEGFLYWGTTHWDYNVRGEERWPDVPWITYNSQPGHNGCGYLLYPGPEGRPLASIRLALVRDGIEDYEYLHLLKSRYEEKKSRLTSAERVEVEALLRVDPAVVQDHKHYTEDPKRLMQAREKLAMWIERLGR